MDELEKYVLGDLREDEAIVQELDSSIKETIDLFCRIDFEGPTHKPGETVTIPSLWPYWILDNDRRNFRNQLTSDARPSGRLSQSTTAMIVAALDVATRYPTDRNRSFSGYRWDGKVGGQPEERTEELNSRLKVAMTALAEQWGQPETAGSDGEEGDRIGTSSSTFGKNDILTVSWHLDLFAPNSSLGGIATGEREKVHKEAEAILTDRVIAYADASSGYAAVVESFNSPEPDAKRIVLDSAYNLLRFIRCIPHIEHALKSNGEFEKLTRTKDRAFYRFQSRLHDQLSFSTITDSRFDGSELVFCLEGMLQLRPDSVNTALLERVMEVMDNAQHAAPNWPSDMPIIADHKGQVLYPISVEIAKSLLASISIFDLHNAQTSLHYSAGTRCLNLIKRYWRWLKTRKTTITINNSDKVSGWQSEKINDPAVIHTWETSQILEFCITFRDQMLRYISRQLLMWSRLEVSWPGPRKNSWQEIVEIFEPVTCLGEEYQIFSDVEKSFINHHNCLSGNKPFWSMMLYGPPGTGKTDIANNISGFLGIPLITITVSDFLAEGEGRMENRAKLVFDVLTRQTAAVVHFDEFDQFLLDRDSVRFTKQGSAFQFLTPGMLTKLNSLRKKANVIFIISTNYEERIDASINRPGRIDKRYLMLPPDGARRIKILNTFENIREELKDINEEWRNKLVSASAFLGYKDLERVANEPWIDIEDFFERLDHAPRNIQFYSYKKRFGLSGEEINLFNGPKEELISLFRLAHEAWDGDTSWTETAKQYECGKTFSRAIIRDLLDKADSISKNSFIRELETHGLTNLSE